ncbi:MAG: zinc ribbon-containing protein [Gammaproteobacteria bacterium]|nr:zinc ribbon-containing protein [Gammaproteobacteria bacterium]
MPTDKQPEENTTLIQAFERMIERVKDVVEKTEQDLKPRIQYAFQQAREKAVALGELTKEEAERVSDYLMRDLQDAAKFLDKNEAEFADWLRFEVDLIENQLLDSVPMLIDETRLVLDQLSHDAELYGEWHTGEITMPGTLQCAACGKEICFHQSGHIPPCANCHATVFKRVPQHVRD